MLLIFASIPFVYFVWALLSQGHRETPRSPLIQGLGWVCLWALLGTIAGMFIYGHASKALSGGFVTGLGEIVLFLPIAWWVMLGGYTVKELFEATAGHRQSTLDNWHYFYLLTWIQLFILAYLISKRVQTKRLTHDPIAWIVAAIVFVNAILCGGWKWWGT